jgi:addiction module HigA family antidote
MARIRTHPGEILREEFLVPLGLSARALAKALGVPANRITEIMRGERDVSADTAIRLARYFRTDPRFWTSRKRRSRTTIRKSVPGLRRDERIANGE